MHAFCNDFWLFETAIIAKCMYLAMNLKAGADLANFFFRGTQAEQWHILKRIYLNDLFGKKKNHRHPQRRGYLLTERP